MKKNIVFLFVLWVIPFFTKAQLQLIDPLTGAQALPAYQFILPEKDSIVKYDLHVKNNDPVVKRIKVVKKIINQATGHESNFCFVLNCYPTSSTVSKPENIKANGTLPEVIQEGVFGLQADFNCKGLKGNSIVRYRVENLANAADTASVEFTYLVDNVLPMQWLSFLVSPYTNGKQVLLEWKIQQEQQDVIKFIIQRSANGRDFTDIGNTEKPVQSRNNINSYQFTDAAVEAGNNIYRIKSIDQAGQVQYSSLQSYFATFTKSALIKLVGSNPIASGSLITLETGQYCSGLLFITLSDLNGRIMLNQTVDLGSGNTYNIIRVKLPSVMAGQYILTARNNNQRMNLNIFIQ